MVLDGVECIMLGERRCEVSSAWLAWWMLLVVIGLVGVVIGVGAGWYGRHRAGRSRDAVRCGRGGQDDLD